MVNFKYNGVLESKFRKILLSTETPGRRVKSPVRGPWKRKLVVSLYAISLASLVYFILYLYEVSIFQFPNETGQGSSTGQFEVYTAESNSADDDNFKLAGTGKPDSVLDGVEEPTCQIPTLDPFHKSILSFVRKPKPLNCLIEGKKKRGNQRLKRKKFHYLFETDLNSNLILVKNLTLAGFESCCYRNYSRTNDYEIMFATMCTEIESTVTRIPPEQEFNIIYCLKTRLIKDGKPSRKHYEMVDIFNIVPLKTEVEERLEKDASVHHTSLEETLNVIVLGLDAVSHMNLMRNMPKTYQYLKEELSALGMNGYTKVGENTFPNIVPALMGLTVEELGPLCWENANDPFDDCPFIWKNFSKAGYRTSYAEDAPWMGIFNYMKHGFLEQPTDYYLRTLTYLMDDRLGHTKRFNANLCYASRPGFFVLLENIKKMAATMGKHKRYFQFTWATSLFHDNINHAALGDKKLRDTLKWLKDGGYLENTALILMSDHGAPYGPILETYQGKVEARMPFLYYTFPKWFSQKYPSALSNMELNGNRLTTPFDFYETLKDLLNLGNIVDKRIEERLVETGDLFVNSNSKQVPRGVSLFLPIPLSRDCEAASISEHFCICHDMLPISPTDELVQEAAVVVVTELNKMLSNFSQCSKLTLEKVINAQIINTERTRTNSDDFNYSNPFRYTVTLSTVPGNAMFEATLNVKHAETASWTVAGEISRINLYGTQSRCVTDYTMKKYCYCE